MDQEFAESARIKGYHAHIYYTAETRAAAARVRNGIGARFQTTLGRWHDEAVGPHPVSMYQVAFNAAEFPRLVPWLMLNRDELSILVHPLSGNGYLDHTRYALWLGTPVPLRLDVLRRLIGEESE
jgi:aromatic ring-cleaving dioxygenase